METKWAATYYNDIVHRLRVGAATLGLHINLLHINTEIGCLFWEIQGFDTKMAHLIITIGHLFPA
jgi:hypothetical protein